MLPNSDSACPKLNLPAPALTITTMSEPGCNFARCSRKNSLTSRFARFRSTEPPTLRLAVIPRRVSMVGPGPWSTRKCRLALPRRPRWIRRKSLRDRTRRARVSRRSVLPASRFRRRYDGQSLAPLGATPLEHQPPTRCGHARSKAMTATTPQIAGLVRSFHGNRSSALHPLRARGPLNRKRELLSAHGKIVNAQAGLLPNGRPRCSGPQLQGNSGLRLRPKSSSRACPGDIPS
jgi:hypothetical protein